MNNQNNNSTVNYYNSNYLTYIQKTSRLDLSELYSKFLKLLPNNARILDAGCGSGILSIAAAMLGASDVLAIDDDPQACAPALENVERNGVASTVEVRQESVTGDLLRALGPFDGIVANIRSGVLLPLLAVLGSSLTAGGWLILSGILEEEWSDFVDAAARADLLCSAVDADGEWRSGCSQRLGGMSL